MQEQAAQISGNKTKSHLPDDFVHVKNFKNLDSMHTNIRENSPDNMPPGLKSEQNFFEEVIQDGEEKEKRATDAHIADNGEELRSLAASEAFESEFWPQESANRDIEAELEPHQGEDGAHAQENKQRKKTKR